MLKLVSDESIYIYIAGRDNNSLILCPTSRRDKIALYTLPRKGGPSIASCILLLLIEINDSYRRHINIISIMVRNNLLN